MKRTTPKKSLSLTVLGLVLYFLQHCFVYAETDRTYSFAFVPQQAASKLACSWTPLLRLITKQTGIKLQFYTAKNIPTFETDLVAGKYDLAYMNPYHYVLYSKQAGYRAFAKARDKKIRGIFVVHKDSPFQSLQDLTGHQLAFPSPQAFAASMLTRNQLNQRNIDFMPVYVSSHDSVYRNIAAKMFAAGGGVLRTYKATSTEVRKQLRILYKTPGYTPHAFSAHPRVPNNVVKAISVAMTHMEATAEGKALLQTLRLKGFSAAHHHDWRDVEALKLKL